MKKTRLCSSIFLLLSMALLGCARKSGTDPSEDVSHKKMWRIPVAHGLEPIPSDKVGFFLEGEEIRKYRLWNGCYSFFGKDSISEFFPKGARLDTVVSMGLYTLTAILPDAPAPLRYPETAYRCLEEEPIAILKLTEGGFENKSYWDWHFIHFRFFYQVRPDVVPHEFSLSFFGQADSASSISWSFSLALSKPYGEFDTTIAVDDIPDAFKAGKDNFIRFGISQFRSENVSNWLCLSEKYRVVSKFN